MNSVSEVRDLLRALTNLIKSEDELVTYKDIDQNVLGTLEKCFYSAIQIEDNSEPVQNCGLFEIESVLDYLQDELNTGHWSEVPVNIRRCFTSSSFVKCLLLLKSKKNISPETLKQCLNSLDMGLLLGAPLERNSDLLTKAASVLSKEISRICKEDVSKTVETGKRKFYEDHGEIFEKLNAIEIDSVDRPSLEHFYKNYYSTQIPVKLKGCMEHWPATKKWLDVNYLLHVAGNRTVPIEIGSHYTDENWTQKLMTLRDFITKHYLENASDVGYLAQHSLFEQIPELKSDICIPEYCCLSENDNETDPDVNAWFGPQGTVSPLHYDPKNNILAQVYGTKQLVLFSPDDSPYLYPHDGKLLFNTAQVDPLRPDLEKFPSFSRAKMYKCLLGPGEMVFMPSKWWHHVSALDKSFSVSFWWE